MSMQCTVMGIIGRCEIGTPLHATGSGVASIACDTSGDSAQGGPDFPACTVPGLRRSVCPPTERRVPSDGVRVIPRALDIGLLDLVLARSPAPEVLPSGLPESPVCRLLLLQVPSHGLRKGHTQGKPYPR